MSNENKNETQKDFFGEVFDTNDHSTKEPRVICAGKISKEQAKELGIDSQKQSKDCR
jgi:uroporphyrinogen-III synthase